MPPCPCLGPFRPTPETPRKPGSSRSTTKPRCATQPRFHRLVAPNHLRGSPPLSPSKSMVRWRVNSRWKHPSEDLPSPAHRKEAFQVSVSRPGAGARARQRWVGSLVRTGDWEPFVLLQHELQHGLPSLLTPTRQPFHCLYLSRAARLLGFARI